MKGRTVRDTYRGRQAWRLLVAGGAAVALQGCSLRVLDPAGPVAAGERTILLNCLAIMLCIILPTMAATLFFAWWYRPGNYKAKRRPDWSFSGRVELVTWSVPLMTIIFLGGIAWIGSHDLDPAKPLPGNKTPLEVQVVSLDWKWLFIYPEQKVATVNQLVVPAGTPVHFSLTSNGVWNSFFVPQLGSQIYTMQGMTTQVNLQADREGSFLGLSSHLSGEGFADMTFETRAVSDQAFASWVKGAQAAPQNLDDDAYKALSKQSSKNPPALYRLADDGLFGKIVGHVLPPGPGPDKGEPTPDVHPKQGS
ncbi:ubiquinol oxidase subunit II [Lichenihabitans sp. Uapishka_5]|uniref:ubiquinol oxidase subunit II n=1 Tax=Lichenihabitans sp. Uapishka_5 TaxID=3037302 RepID=UPI0029E7FD44|nr:ubiquinol oxidase subunit II [Lichenihabitans sp. Uapishka_5]MDX7953080.1 ubiquinol oxidase subunit II [Lichenihabitans sp. Uapishka_5]